jgi:hypothetical protein
MFLLVLMVVGLLLLELFVAIIYPTTTTAPLDKHPLQNLVTTLSKEEATAQTSNPIQIQSKPKVDLDCDSIPFFMPMNIATNNVSLMATSATRSNWDGIPPPIHKPIFVPAYPGSGSELFRSLVTAMTGGMEGADWYLRNNNRCNNYPATCKVHCPVLPGCQQDFGLYAHNERGRGYDMIRPNYYHYSAILLLRNPQKALPSHVNWIWERRKQKKETTHQSQAPEWWWRQYRDQRFMRLMNGWRTILVHWVGVNDNYNNKRRNKQNNDPNTVSPFNVTLILPYEWLTLEEYGPSLLHRVTTELQQAQIPVVVPPSDYVCLWRRVVQAKDSKTKRTKLYEPGFTEEQQTKMVNVINGLVKRFASRPDLIDMLTEYRDDIATNLRIDTVVGGGPWDNETLFEVNEAEEE